MALLNYMQRNRFGVYEYKRRIPKDLLDKFPQYKSGFVKFSLQTKDANEAKRMKQQQDALHEAKFDMARGGAESTPVNAPVKAAAVAGMGDSKTQLLKTGFYLSDLEQIWRQETHRASKTVDSMHRMVLKFEGLHGKLDIANITKKHVVEFKAYISKLPSNRASVSDTLSASTINKYIVNLGVLLNVANDKEYITTINAAKGLRQKISVQEKANRRQPFSDNDLNILFATTAYKQGLGKTLLNKTEFNVGLNSRYWLPLLGLFTGARVEELAQLTVQDVLIEQGISIIDINANAGKTIKNASSVRKVPIHNELIRLGFLDYCTSVKAAGHKHIFFDLTGYGDKKSAYFSKWFGYYKCKLGIPNPLKVYHSFRHTFEDAGRDSGVAKDARYALTGRTDEGSGEGYGDGFSLRMLNEQMQKIQIPINLAPHYVDTKIGLNPIGVISPHVPQPTIIAQEVPIKLNGNTREFITLADAYHHIGKAIYDEKWQDYAVIDCIDGNWMKTDLSDFVRHQDNFTKKPELKIITENQFNKLSKILATEKEIEVRERVLRLFTKAVHGFEFLPRPISRNTAICPQALSWISQEYELQLNLSRLRRIADNVLWEVVVSPECLRYYYLKQGAKKNPKGGNKPKILWKEVDDFIIGLFMENPKITASACEKKIEAEIKANQGKYVSHGVTLHDAIPSLSAIKSRIQQLCASGDID